MAKKDAAPTEEDENIVDQTTSPAEEDEIDLDSWFEDLEDEEEITSEEAEDGEEPESPEEVPDDGVATTPQLGSASDGVSEEDWIASLPEDIRPMAQALQNNYKSQLGRVASMRTQLEEANARLASRTTVEASASQRTGSQAKRELPPKLKEFAEEYPEITEHLEEYGRMWQQDIQQQVEQRLKPLAERAEYDRLSAAKAKFTRGAEQILDTANTGISYTDVIESAGWKQFLEAQPPVVRQLAKTSQDPDEALWILSLFVEKAVGAQAQAAPEQPAPVKKSAKLAKHATPRSKSLPVGGSDLEGDYEAIFNSIAD